MKAWYFAPRLRAAMAFLASKKGLDAWRHFVDLTTFHRLCDQRVSDAAFARLRPFPVAYAVAMAEYAVNCERPEGRSESGRG